MQKHGEMRQSGCYGNFTQFCESGIQGVDGAVGSEGQEMGRNQTTRSCPRWAKVPGVHPRSTKRFAYSLERKGGSYNLGGGMEDRKEVQQEKTRCALKMFLSSLIMEIN